MPEIVNTSFLGSTLEHLDNEKSKIMVEVKDVTMIFNMANETLNSLKEYAIALVKGELHFKEFRALDDISLQIREGDVFGLLGTNGSGKSTLLKIIAGVLEPSKGKCTINGNIAPLIELGAGFDLELTARENIYLNGALLGYSRKFIDEHFEEIVDFAEVRKFLDMPMKNYSSGMVARIAFAIATAVVPEILIVDEVLSVGDFMFQQKCERRINSLIKEHNVTVIIVSHDNDQIRRLCNKAAWIEKGHLRMAGDAEEVCRVYHVLGGHVGSEEAERRVYEVLNSPIQGSAGITSIISSENRYGTAVEIFSRTALYGKTKCVVVAPGENDSLAMLGSALAAGKSAAFLLTKPGILPDITMRTLKEGGFEEVVLVGNEEQVGNDVLNQIKACSNAAISRLEDRSPFALANRAFEIAKSDFKESDTAVLTWPGCTGDLLSLAPYSNANKCPLFFHEDNGVINDETLSILTKNQFKRVLILGGQESFPDACLEPLLSANIEIIRFCGKDPYDANWDINRWIDEQSGTQRNELIVSSVWDPSDAFGISSYAAENNAMILLSDPQNLDSINNAFNFIEQHGKSIKKITFLGNHTRFNETDRSLIEKAHAKAQSSYKDYRENK